MVSGFEKRMLSGMFGLLSVDCAKAGEVALATASVTAPATTRLRETWVENCGESSEESVSAMVTATAIRRQQSSGQCANQNDSGFLKDLGHGRRHIRSANELADYTVLSYSEINSIVRHCG